MMVRVRNKISFMAFEKRMTVKELIVSTILRCYREYGRLEIPKYFIHKEANSMKEEIFDSLVNGKTDGFLRNIIKFNDEVANNEVFQRNLQELESK